jgi:hypothetical protein
MVPAYPLNPSLMDPHVDNVMSVPLNAVDLDLSLNYQNTAFLVRRLRVPTEVYLQLTVAAGVMDLKQFS